MFPNDPVPQDILQGGNKNCASGFPHLPEVWKKEGSPYPPRTIHLDSLVTILRKVLRCCIKCIHNA